MIAPRRLARTGNHAFGTADTSVLYEPPPRHAGQLLSELRVAVGTASARDNAASSQHIDASLEARIIRAVEAGSERAFVDDVSPWAVAEGRLQFASP